MARGENGAIHPSLPPGMGTLVLSRMRLAKVGPRHSVWAVCFSLVEIGMEAGFTVPWRSDRRGRTHYLLENHTILKTFKGLGVRDDLIPGMEELGIKTPTAIQRTRRCGGQISGRVRAWVQRNERQGERWPPADNISVWARTMGKGASVQR